jgi:hypothetical protein
MSGAITPLPNTPSWRGAQLKHREERNPGCQKMEGGGILTINFEGQALKFDSDLMMFVCIGVGFGAQPDISHYVYM